MTERAIVLNLVRSIAFNVLFYLNTLFWLIVGLPTFFMPYRAIIWVAKTWGRVNLVLLRVAGIDYELRGTEKIPPGPLIVASKHQSTWETLTLNFWFTPQSWVVKRELLWAPIFGWGMRMMNPIALDRGAGRKAIEQLVEQGRERLEKGRWIIIFPEGTRIAPGKKGRYRIGGAVLAERTGYPVTPVAHNAGEYWPRRQFIKKPGVIQVRIGPRIESEHKTAQQILSEAERWIESEMANITTLQQHDYGKDPVT